MFTLIKKINLKHIYSKTHITLFFKKTILIGFTICANYILAQNYTLTNFELRSYPTPKKISASAKKLLIKKVNDTIKIFENSFKDIKGDSLPFNSEDITTLLNNKKGIDAVKKVSNGYLIGFNGGEFGGGLWFLSKDGKSAYEIRAFINIQQIFEFNSKIYALTGLRHLAINSGALLELRYEKKWHVLEKHIGTKDHKAEVKVDEIWNISKITRLESKPYFIVKEHNYLLIITAKNILSFDTQDTLKKITKLPSYWDTLTPTSALIDDTILYIATKQGVLKILDFKTLPKYQWYIKKT